MRSVDREALQILAGRERARTMLEKYHSGCYVEDRLEGENGGGTLEGTYTCERC